MLKRFILTIISIIISFFAVQAAPVMPTVGSGTYYYIRFKATGNVIQDNGANAILTCQAFVPGNTSQFWKVDNGVTSGTYILTSGNGRKMYFNTGSSRYTAVAGSGTEIVFTTSANATYTNSYELGRTAISNKLNPLGGPAGSQVGEFTLGDNGNAIEFLYAPVVSTSTSYTYYNIKFSRGKYIKDTGLNNNITQTDLVSNASDQLWRIEATSAGASTIYLVSKLGNRLCYNGDRYRAQKDGNIFNFSATNNSTYPSRWELNRVGGQTVNDAFQTQVTDYYANDGGNPIEFTFVETLNAKAILLNQINIATTIKNAAVVGTLAGQYAQASVDALTTAYATTAQGVYDNVASTNTDYQNATTALLTAIDTFYGTTIYPVTLSNAGSPTWYYIVGATGNPNGAGKSVIVDPLTFKSTWGTTAITANQMFRFERITGSPKFKIINMFFEAGGLSFSKSPYNSDQISYDNSASESWEISPLTYTSGTNNGNQYTVTSNGSRLHLAANLSQLVNYDPANTYNSASAFSFTQVSGTDATTALAGVMNILTGAINTANATHTALNGTNPGQISSSSVNSTFGTAITTATNVKNKTNPVATNTEITNACIALSSAQTTYTSSTTNAFKYSTLGNETWYAIRNVYYSTGNYLKDNGLGVVAGNATYSLNQAFLWKIVDVGGGKVNIISKVNSGQLTNTITNSQPILLTATAQERTITSLGLAQFNINGGTHSVHLNGNILGWNASLNSASAWKFEEIKDVTPTLTTNIVSSITSTTATCGGIISSDGIITNLMPPTFPGEESATITVSAKGVCWSTSQNPTVSLSTKTNEGQGTSSFTSSITGLVAGTTYYVRSYATNYLGTGYGPQTSFVTPLTLEYSNETRNVWYSIKTPGRTGENFITDKGLNTNLKGEDFVDGNDAQLWKLVDVGNGQVNIISKLNGGHMAAPTAYYTASQLVTTPTAFTLSYLDQEQYNVNATNFQLHLQADRVLVRWSAGVGSASAWILEKRKVEVKGTITSASLPDCTNSDVIIDNSAQLTVNTAKTLKSITVEPGAKVNFSSGLTVGDVTLKANVSSSFNAMIGSGNTVTGTVKYQRTIDDTKWYFMAFPCDIAVNNIVMLGGGTINADFVIKRYDGQKRATDANTKGSNWKVVNAGETLNANQGYIFGLSTNNNSSKTLEFPLTQSLITSESSKTVPATYYDSNIGPNNKGWNLIGQPYLSAFSGSNVGINYITKHNGTAYIGAANSEVAKIDPFEAFFVQVANSNPISFGVAGRQSTKSVVSANSSDNFELKIANSTGIDKTNLIIDDGQLPEYEIGADLEKWIVTGTDKPQIYSVLSGISYAYNALPFNSVQSLPIGIYSKTKSSVTIQANLINTTTISQLLLKDNTTGVVTDLLNSSYTFTTEAGTFNNRFNVSVKRISTDVLDTNSCNEKAEPVITTLKNNIAVSNLNSESTIKIYDTTGRVLMIRNSVNGVANLYFNQKGIYLVEVTNNSNKWVKKVAIK